MASLLPQFDKLNHKYNLVADGQKILIAVSGGIDSLILCRILNELRLAEFKRLELQAAYVRLEPVALSDTPLKTLTRQLADWHISLTVLSGRYISETEFDCYTCARERRRQLFEFTTKNGFDSLAFGHNLDDYLETGLLNLLFNGSLESLRPVQLLCDEQIRIIRPLLSISKKHISASGHSSVVQSVAGNCRFALENKRAGVRQMIHAMSRVNRRFRGNLRRAVNHWNQLEI